MLHLNKIFTYIKNCLNFKYTLFFFILANVLSFFSLWISYPVGIVFSILSLIFLLIFNNQLIRILLDKQSIFFLLFIIFQCLSFVNYLLIDYSWQIIYSNPSLILQAISYILLPQILFYYLGFIDAKNKTFDENLNLRLITIIFLFVFVFGIYLHFIRPLYFVYFQERVFLSDKTTGYIDFYPKFTIFWNSMIVGVLGVSLFWTTLLVKNRQIWFKFISGVIFFIAVIFSTQRGAWASLLISGLIFFIFFFSLTGLKYLFLLSILLGFGLIVSSNFIEIDSPIFVDLFNRFNAIDNAFNERSYQFENFIYLISKFPFGVGLGLLSHKASDLNLLFTTPDGNYYRIFGETGFFGFVSFAILIISSVYKSYKRKLKLFFIIIIVYLLQSLGTNVLDLYAASFFFWYVIGQVNGSGRNPI
jgi:hypothetical protein